MEEFFEKPVSESLLSQIYQSNPTDIVPPLDEIPLQYHLFTNHVRLHTAVDAIMKGGRIMHHFGLGRGVNSIDAAYHIYFIARNIDISIEHKYAALAMLLDKWFILKTKGHDNR